MLPNFLSAQAFHVELTLAHLGLNKRGGGGEKKKSCRSGDGNPQDANKTPCVDALVIFSVLYRKAGKWSRLRK